jgi:RNA polymerase sigma-70 factor (ECF subfamily)
MEEKELIRRSTQGDENAFSLLVKAYKTKVFNLAYSFTRDRDMADDLAQEVFIKAYFALPKFKYKAEFGTWLYRIATNHIRDHLRKKGRSREANIEATIKRTPSQENDKGIALLREQRIKLVHDAIHTLSEKHQIILSLRDIQGLPYEKITKILNVSPGTVNSRIHRARKILRKKIAPFLFPKGGSYEM